MAHPSRSDPWPAHVLPQLSTEQVAEFRDQGFLAIAQLTTPADLARIHRILTELYSEYFRLPRWQALDLGDDAHAQGRLQIPEINWALRLAPALRTTLAFARCQALAEQLLGCAVRHTGYDHAILKPPHNGRATPWHQDGAYTEVRGPFGSIHFWIPLQDVTIASGCMQFIPGSHQGPLLPHSRRGDQAHVLEARGVDAARAVACPLAAGGATVHWPRTLHYTGPNAMNTPRLAWSLEFGTRRPRVWRALARRGRGAAALGRSLAIFMLSAASQVARGRQF